MARRYFGRACRGASAAQRKHRQESRRRALRCEQLEERRLLAVLTVDTELDVVDFNDGLMSLREAVFVANTIDGHDEIRFDFGHDQPATMLLAGGEIAITEELTIVGPGSEALTIDAQQNSRIFNVLFQGGEGVGVELSGMTLLNGRTTGDNLTTSEITQHTHSGGTIRGAAQTALYLDDLVIRGSSVTGANAAGGAIFAAGILQVTNSVVSGNSAGGRNGVGGGIAATGSVQIVATTIASNVASRGGGVSVASTGRLEIDRSTLNNNVAADSYAALGGAIYSTALITTITSSTISGNAARVTGFDAVAQGGGVWLGGAWEIAFSTIVTNTASSVGAGAVATAGGIYSRFTPTPEDPDRILIDHTIVAGNFATEGYDDLLRASTVRLDIFYSLIGNNDGSLVDEAPFGSPDGYGNLIGGMTSGFIDPLIGGLEDNGGPTRTHALLPGSPAIFAGSPWRVPGDSQSGGFDLPDTPLFDQRGVGYSRRTGTRLDIGAVEYSGRTLIVDSLGDDVDGDLGQGKFTLREALAVANESPDYDVIEFSPSLLTGRPTTIYLKNGALPITQEAAIYGPGSEVLAISGSENLAYFNAINASANLELRGLTITDVDARSSLTGGGIYSTKDLTLVDVAVTDCIGGSGAGIKGVNLTLIASRVEGNRATLGTGGIELTDSLHMDRSLVRGNQAGNFTSSVGGIRVGTASTVRFDTEVIVANSVITNNTGVNIGGMDVQAAFFVMHNTLVAENSGRLAGGFSVNSVETLILNSSVVQNVGLGIRIVRGWNAIIEDSTISSNRTPLNGVGGGVSSADGLTVRRSTITNNSLPRPSGQQGSGSGISISGRLVLESSIVAGNHGPTAPDISISSNGSINASYSLIGDNRGTTLVETGGDNDQKGNYIGGPQRGVLSPGLGPLMNNGGWLPTHLPLPGSAAIDGGPPTAKPGDGTTPEFDQRGAGYQRVAGRRIDIGAVEVQLSVGTASADFNQDRSVDGDDFLDWQLGYGKSEPTLSDGDATRDGQVDGNDLAYWKLHYGVGAPRIAPAATLASTTLFALASPASAETAAPTSEMKTAEAFAEVAELAEVPANEFVGESSTLGRRAWGVPLTPAVESFARQAVAAEAIVSKHAAFAAVGEFRGGLTAGWDEGLRREAEGAAGVEVVDVAFAEVEEGGGASMGMGRLAWGLTGR